MTRPDTVSYPVNTINGWKALIFLHKAQIDYEPVSIFFGKNEQKAPYSLRLKPNGPIPTIVDRGADDVAVFESGAILWYLAEKYDRFLSHDPEECSE